MIFFNLPWVPLALSCCCCFSPFQLCPFLCHTCHFPRCPPHTGPLPQASFLQNTTHSSLPSRADLDRRVGLMGGGMAVQHGQVAFRVPRIPYRPLQRHLVSVPHPPTLSLSTVRPWGSPVPQLHAHHCIFLTMTAPLPRGLCHSPNSKAPKCSQPYEVAFKCPYLQFSWLCLAAGEAG